MIYFAAAFLVLILDQASKWLVVERMTLNETRYVIGHFFAITSHRNKGAAFGILQDQRLFFIAITIVIVIGIVWYLRKSVQERKKLLAVALSLLLGGALGNFIDRLLYGEVVDFLQFHFLFELFGVEVDYIYPIFNIADSAIVVGVSFIFWDALRGWREEKRGLAQ